MVDASMTSSVSPVWWVYSLLLGVFWLFCYWLDNFVLTFIVCMIGGVIGEVVIGFIPEDLMKGHDGPAAEGKIVITEADDCSASIFDKPLPPEPTDQYEADEEPEPAREPFSEVGEESMVAETAAQSQFAQREPSPEPVREPSPELVREPSPEPVREPSPEHVREPSPEPVREPSPEPVRDPSPEPVREPSPVPIREPSPEPIREPSPELAKEKFTEVIEESMVAEAASQPQFAQRDPSPEPERESSPEPMKEPSPEPVREPSPEPIREPSPEPIREPSPELLEQTKAQLIEEAIREPSPEPVKENSPEPVREPSPEPVREPSPEPVREPSPEPVREPSPEPVREPSPEPVREPSPEPVREPSPEPARELSPEPVRKPSPNPIREQSPEPMREPSPKPIRESSPEPVGEPSPKPRTPSPEPVREQSPEPIRDESPLQREESPVLVNRQDLIEQMESSQQSEQRQESPVNFQHLQESNQFEPQPGMKRQESPVAQRDSSPEPVHQREADSPVQLRQEFPDNTQLRQESPEPVQLRQESPEPAQFRQESPKPFQQSPEPIEQRQDKSPEPVQLKSDSPVLTRDPVPPQSTSDSQRSPSPDFLREQQEAPTQEPIEVNESNVREAAASVVESIKDSLLLGEVEPSFSTEVNIPVSSSGPQVSSPESGPGESDSEEINDEIQQAFDAKDQQEPPLGGYPKENENILDEPEQQDPVLVNPGLGQLQGENIAVSSTLGDHNDEWKKIEEPTKPVFQTEIPEVTDDVSSFAKRGEEEEKLVDMLQDAQKEQLSEENLFGRQEVIDSVSSIGINSDNLTAQSGFEDDVSRRAVFGDDEEQDADKISIAETGSVNMSPEKKSESGGGSLLDLKTSEPSGIDPNTTNNGSTTLLDDDFIKNGDNSDIDLDDPKVSEAATKIQAAFKGFKTRQQLKEM